jgi:hypothetical protein
MTHWTRAAVLTAILLVPAAVAPAQQDVPYVYQGTVHAVKGGAVDLITGVGHALRLVHMRTLPTTEIATVNGAASLSVLKPGDVVRADCHKTDTGLVADRIEIKRPSS